jgi:RimJ/RimL family protein N-acetyltransferase
VIARADDPLGILGYAVTRAPWGLWFATEAAGGLTAFAFDELRLDPLQASVLRENPASKRVLEHLGFTLEEAGLLEQPLSRGPPRLVDRYVLARGNQVDTGARVRLLAE